ncbi:unnamed protein product [marine sediment metagenome]|uniref:YgjP-like metallopeptidase domain-containing protein n=1 Tax=marine sediment metagenome TaxID=412755 RepID=X1BRP1_9ZZZZ
MTWPPPYTIRTSARTKRVSLRVIPHQGLEVVIPPGYKIKKIPKLINRQHAWIEKHLAKIADIPKPSLPKTLQLHAINEIWDIDYIETTDNRFTLIPNPQNKLTIMGDINNYESCEIITHKWLQQKAKTHLIPWLQVLSNKINLSYNNISIRNQKTRWGSCSTRKNINLNCQLLLLPQIYAILLRENIT